MMNFKNNFNPSAPPQGYQFGRGAKQVVRAFGRYGGWGQGDQEPNVDVDTTYVDRPYSDVIYKDLSEPTAQEPK